MDAEPKMVMALIYWTQFDPTRYVIDPTQPNNIQIFKTPPNPTQPVVYNSISGHLLFSFA